VHWLDQHSGSVTALATIVLALITGIYVRLTRSLANANESLATSSQKVLVETQRANELTRDANDLTRRTIDMQTEELRRRQASQVTTWVQPGHLTAGGNTFLRMPFSNASSEPVFNCWFTAFINGAQFHQHLPMLGPGGIGDMDVPVSAPPGPPDVITWAFTFSDNAGVRWRRTSEGEMTEVEASRGPG
jgi:hypothetical protein